MKSCAPTGLAALTISASVASGRANAMLSRTVPGEEEALLRHDAELAAQRRLRHVVDVVPVDRDPPAARLVEAREQLRDRRLARARVPDERDGRPGRDVERDAVQHLDALPVAEAHVLERTCPSMCGSSTAPGRSTISGSSSSSSVIRSSAATAERNVL